VAGLESPNGLGATAGCQADELMSIINSIIFLSFSKWVSLRIGVTQRDASGRFCQANIRVVGLVVAQHVVTEVSLRYQLPSSL